MLEEESIEPPKEPSRQSLRGLDWLNFLLADVQTGVGPFLAIYLAAQQWNEERVGLALTVGGIAGILTQTPMGALVDFLRSKRALVGAGVAALAAGAIVIALFPNFWPLMGAQVLIGGTSSVFIPAICAMSLGIVGSASFDTRQGRNQAFNSAGNVTAALSMGLLGYLISDRSIFFFVMALAIPTILVLLLIAPGEIDYDLARGARKGETGGRARSVWILFKDRPLVIFLVCAVMFHFANAAMLPLLGEQLAKGQGRSSMLFLGIVQRLLASPTPRAALVLGKGLSAGVRTLSQAAIVYGLSLLLGVSLNGSPLAVLNVLIIVVLTATLFATFSLIIACIVKTRERFMGVGQVLTMPLFFASNAIYPTSIMPGWLKTISHLNPLTYVVDALRTSMLVGSTSTFGLGHDYAVLLTTTTVLVFLGSRLYPHLAS
jgi:MFS family permease